MNAEVSILTQVDLQVVEHADCTRAPGTINGGVRCGRCGRSI
jgi:hypothetical protein